MVLSHPAHLGEAYYVLPQGDNVPLVERKSIPSNRGAKLAWALSFIGEDKCVKSEADFYSQFDYLVGTDTITNIAAFTKYGKYGIILANKHILSETAPNGRSKVIINTPILAWISDTISFEDLTDLLNKYSSRIPLPCNKEFFYLL